MVTFGALLATRATARNIRYSGVKPPHSAVLRTSGTVFDLYDVQSYGPSPAVRKWTNANTQSQAHGLLQGAAHGGGIRINAGPVLHADHTLVH